MCSICGIAFQKGHEEINPVELRKFFARLLVEAQWRGPVSTGIAVVDEKKITVVKNNLRADKFVESSEWRKVSLRSITQPIQIIGHCRAPTKGSASNNDNNHPIVAGNVVGVHNGHVSNDDFLFQEFIEEFKRVAEVDSEIIFQLLNHFSKETDETAYAIEQSSNLMRGGYACAAVNAKNPYVLWLFRNTSPCDILHFKEKGVIVFASSEAFIKNALEEIDLGKGEKIEMERDSALGINLFNNTIHRFSIEENKETMYAGGYA